jgi:DNA-directed RNA polymerase subunit M/transcription elongation factor TFIIS
MARIDETATRTVCEKCGAAMVIVRVWQIPEEPEVHMFRCEICDHSAFFRFKPKRPPLKPI